MHPTRPQSIINELSGHASLLLSASPTIINSPLQNNTNNTSTSSNKINKSANASANHALASSGAHCSDDELPDDNINFKKPQNEIFKKLDGKIQSIMAAHSNFNKLYALNDFSSGPRKPFELPAPLPRPPPWVPKTSSDYGCSQWAEETLTNLNRVANEDLDNSFRQSTSISGSNLVVRSTPKTNVLPQTKTPTLSIDSAISKIHQRRQLEQQGQSLTITPQQLKQARFQLPRAQPRISEQALKIHQIEIKPVPTNRSQGAARSLFPSPSGSNQSAPRFSPGNLEALNALIRKQQQQQMRQNQRVSNQPNKSTGPTSISSDLTPEERKKFQKKLINIFTQEIEAVTRLTNVKFPQSAERPRTAEQQSLLLKKSPQSLYNTIRHQTSLLLNRNDPNRSGVSILSEQQSSSTRAQFVNNLQAAFRPVVNRYHTVKVVVPPTEFFKHSCGKQPSGKGDCENKDCNCLKSKTQISNVDEWCPPRQFTLKYRNLQMKLYQLKYIQKRDELNRKRGISISMLPADARKSKQNPQKTLDRIVDRLQARCNSSNSCSPTTPGLQPKNSANDQSERSNDLTPSASPKVSHSHEVSLSPPMSPKPIPVCRSALTSGRSGYLTSGSSVLSSNISKVASQKLKKAKRLHNLGLRLNNYMDKDNPQPTTDKISLDQFAKCLNLVRSNDASLRRHQEKLTQSEMKWRIPVSDRPMRLRRIHGDKMRMPASASYRATRKVGLQ